MSDAQITREGAPNPSLIPPLDRELEIELSAPELAFLRAAIPGTDDEVKEKIRTVQKELYSKFPYQCIRGFHFASVRMATCPIYPTVVEEGRTGSTVFLDIGCMMGTDVRKLVWDGYPAQNVLACDLRQEFIDIGYGLFQDRDKTGIRLFTSDAFQLPTAASPVRDVPLGEVTSLEQLQGRVDHVYTGSLFHLFDEPTQYALALRIATLLKRTGTCTVFGRHRGTQESALVPDIMDRNARYMHSPKSWGEMWKQVFEEQQGDIAPSSVHVDAKLAEESHLFWSVRVSWT